MKKNIGEKKMKLALTARIFILLLFSLYMQNATAVLQLMPPIQEVKVQRGNRGTFTITVNNVGDEDVPGKFYIFNMDISTDGAPFIADSTYQRGFADWVVLDPREAIIKAHEGIMITGTISVPREAQGGYYALVRGEFSGTTIPLKGKNDKNDKSGIELMSQAGVAVFLTVPSSRNKAIIIPDTMLVFPAGANNQEVNFGNTGKNGWRVAIPVRNDGNIHTRIAGAVSFYRENGTQVEAAPLTVGKGYILPGRTRNLHAEGEEILSDGYYMIRVYLQTSDNHRMSKSFPFSVYQGEVYPGAQSEQLAELIRSTSPGFILKEPFLNKTVTPRGETYLSIQLTNSRQDTLILIPRKMEWDLNEMGIPVLGKDRAFQPRSCTSWLKFSQDQYKVFPGKPASLKIVVNVPSDITGEYYAAVVLDPDKSSPDLAPEFMAPRTQLIALKSSGELNYKIEIDSVTLKRESAKGITLSRFRFGIKNGGNTHCYADGSLSLEKQYAPGVYKPEGKSYDFGDNQTYILPGNKRKFEVNIPNLEKGYYRVILIVNYKEEAQPAMKYQRMEIK